MRDKPACDSVRPSEGQRRWLYGTFAACAVSGLLWLAFHYGLRVEGDFGPSPHPLESWWLRIHGGAAMLLLLALGALLPLHIIPAWRRRHHAISGIFTGAALIILIATGYGLYYIVGESLRPWLSVLHWGVGTAAIPLLLVHIGLARAKRAAQENRTTACAGPGQSVAAREGR